MIKTFRFLLNNVLLHLLGVELTLSKYFIVYVINLIVDFVFGLN